MAEVNSDILKMYNEMRKIPLNQWTKVDQAKADKVLGLSGKDAGQGGTTFQLIARVAHSTNRPEEFQDFIQKNELPSLKLTAQEMELVRGGRLGTLCRMAYNWCCANSAKIGAELCEMAKYGGL